MAPSLAHLSNLGNKNEAKILIAATHLGLCALNVRPWFNVSTLYIDHDCALKRCTIILNYEIIMRNNDIMIETDTYRIYLESTITLILDPLYQTVYSIRMNWVVDVNTYL